MTVFLYHCQLLSDIFRTLGIARCSGLATLYQVELSPIANLRHVAFKRCFFTQTVKNYVIQKSPNTDIFDSLHPCAYQVDHHCYGKQN